MILEKTCHAGSFHSAILLTGVSLSTNISPEHMFNIPLTISREGLLSAVHHFYAIECLVQHANTGECTCSHLLSAALTTELAMCRGDATLDTRPTQWLFRSPMRGACPRSVLGGCKHMFNDDLQACQHRLLMDASCPHAKLQTTYKRGQLQACKLKGFTTSYCMRYNKRIRVSARHNLMCTPVTHVQSGVQGGAHGHPSAYICQAGANGNWPDKREHVQHHCPSNYLRIC